MKKNIPFIAGAGLYCVWFFVSYALTIIIRTKLTTTILHGEIIEAIAVNLAYVAPLDFVFISITILPIVLILTRKYIPQEKKNILLGGIATGIILGTFAASLPFSIAWRLMLITSIF